MNIREIHLTNPIRRGITCCRRRTFLCYDSQCRFPSFPPFVEEDGNVLRDSFFLDNFRLNVNLLFDTVSSGILKNPAQRILNLLIFLYNKVHILRESRKEALSFRQALKIIIVNPREVPEFLIPSLELLTKTLQRENKKEMHRKQL